MKTVKRSVSIMLVLLMIVSTALIASVFSASAAGTISYSFTNQQSGTAEGTITITPASDSYGTYYLYWADNTKALEGYREIASISVTSGSGKYTMPAHTAIPADATKLIAVKSSSKPSASACTVAAAAAVYSIPQSKQLSFSSKDVLYTFGAISDPQLANDSYGSNSYPNDETHLAAAFETLAKRGVNFTVTSGDTVNDQNGGQTFAAEYKSYQKILADSSYCNPIYETNGNHDSCVNWKGSDAVTLKAYIKATGLDSNADTLSMSKPYYEITEPITGDHFIFMSVEGGFYTNKNEQFSAAQLDWLEGLLKKYNGDGKNIFIMEHANVENWGSGDKFPNPFYDLPLMPSTQTGTARFVKLMETYKKCIIITGHTHLELSAQLNYSDNNGTSAVMMHNSAIGGVRRVVNGTVNRSPVLGLSEGYIIEVYEDCVIFNGTNMYYNEIMPSCSYIIPFTTSAEEKPSDPVTDPVTAPVTEPDTTTPTTTVNTTEPITTVPVTTAPATTATAPVSTDPTTPEVYIYGDADLNGSVNVKDATLVQKHAADIVTITGKAFIQANVNGDTAVNVRDATYIQKFVANLIVAFPAERDKSVASVSADSFQAELTAAKSALESYYTYSSYDQYMALKKAYRSYKSASLSQSEQTKAAAELSTLREALFDIAGDSNFTAPNEITVYFTNNKSWSKVYAYVWGSGGTKVSWPGEEMTYVKTNNQSQKIYSVTFSYDDYQKIIFSGDGTQTVDIQLTGDNNVGYFISGTSGSKLTCDAYAFS